MLTFRRNPIITSKRYSCSLVWFTQFLLFICCTDLVETSDKDRRDIRNVWKLLFFQLKKYKPNSLPTSACISNSLFIKIISANLPNSAE